MFETPDSVLADIITVWSRELAPSSVRTLERDLKRLMEVTSDDAAMCVCPKCQGRAKPAIVDCDYCGKVAVP